MRNRTQGSISINVNGTVSGLGARGDGIYASIYSTIGGSVDITAATVTGGRFGIFVYNDKGTGNVSISVSGTVTGGTGASHAAIKTLGSSGRNVTISLSSGASVGTTGGNAIVDTGGNANVTVNTGASITGKVNLGAGNDTLTFSGGAFSNVTEMKGGAGNDSLTFSGGASGAMSGVSEWETVSIQSGSTVSFGTGTHTLTMGTLTVASGGTLNVGDDSDTGDELTVSGNFAGGGTVILDANFSLTSSGADNLTISGNVTGATTLNLSRIGTGNLTDANSAARIDGVISVTGTVAAGAFSLGTITGISATSAFTYELEFNAANKRFDLVRVSDNACEATTGTSGAFTCSGVSQIGAAQSLSASGATALSVTLHSETPVDTDSSAFTLAQTGGGGGITLTQSGSGERIKGAQSGIVAANSGGGAISIDVNGTVTGVADDGISATNDASGSGIMITAVSVSGADSGIKAVEGGSGAVSIIATGTVTGVADHGIYAKTATFSAASLSVTAATVTGGKTGIRAIASGTGAVSIKALGAVAGTAEAGIKVNSYASASDMMIDVAAVTGNAGIDARHGGSGKLDIKATGSVSGSGTEGIFGLVSDSSGGALTITAAAVAGSSHGIRALSSGTGDLSISASGSVSGTGTNGRGIEAQRLNFSGGGSGIMIAAVSVSGADSGIEAVEGGSGAVRIMATGTVTGVSEEGVYAKTGSDGAITVTAAAVTGGEFGIKVSAGGSGAVKIMATGTVTGVSEEGVYAKTGSGGAITVTAAAVTGGKFGVRASAGGSGAVSVRASSAVSATATSGIGIDASASGGAVTISAAAVTGTATGIKVAAAGAGRVSISASGSVVGTAGDGIFVDHDGTGATTIAVSSAVTGGTGTGNAAIRTDVSTGRSVTVTLNSGASVGTGTNNAIVGSGGNTAVTVNSGAAVTGNVNLGGGADTLTLNSGATISGSVALGSGSDTLTLSGGTFSNVTEMDGGDGSGDTLTFSRSDGTVSLHTTVVSQGLKGWESVVVESGATISGHIKLANDSGNLTFDNTDIANIGTLTASGNNNANTLTLNSVSGSLNGSNVTGWEMVRVGAGSTIRFGSGTHGLTADSLRVTGTLDVGDDSDTDDRLTVLGAFAGGGTVILNANFGSTSPAADILAISGNATGATTVNLSRIGTGNITQNNGVDRINGVITATGTVNAGAFSLGTTGIGRNSAFTYELQFDATNKRFDLVRVSRNACEAVSGSSGAFTCSEANQIGAAQSLSASGATALSVTLHSETPVDTDATAFTLAQTGGGGGVTFTQSGSGERIKGAQSGIVATNSGGGAISINVNGTVMGAADDGISATNDASGSGITITAASVSGADSGIKAVEGGSGAVRIMATGTVTGVSEEGVYAKTGSDGAITVTAAAVTGGKFGIRASAGGSGAVSVRASGAVSATAASGIGIDASASGGAVTISAAAVTGTATGIKVSANGGGAISISVNGTVTGAAGDGISASSDASGSGITIAAASVSGADSGIKAVEGGSGAVRIMATGTVAGAAGDGISVSSDASGSGITITAASVSGATSGIKVMATGTGSVSISASGAVTGTGSDGIFMDHDGTGAAAIAVSSVVTGGAGTGNAAIRTDVSSGSAVTVSLNSGASVGAGTNNAIVGSDGDTAVTVNVGAAIAGKVRLGAGNDRLTFAGGGFSNVTEMQGGAGIDTLRFSGGAGSLHATVQSQGLEGWESVVIQGGATLNGNIKLANDSDNLTFDRTSIAGVGTLAADGSNNANTLSFNGVSGSLAGKTLTGWETVRVGAGSTIKLADGTRTLQADLSVASGGTLDVGDDSNTSDRLTVSGNFSGGGTVILNANFGSTSSGADILEIRGNVSGTTTVSLSRIGAGSITRASAGRINGVITATGTVDGGAFRLGATGIGRISAFTYKLEFDAANKRFDLVRVSSNECEATTGNSGAFNCRGSNQIGTAQSLSASGAAALSVTLHSETLVDTDGTALTLTQTGGAGGVTFIQSGSGRRIKGAQSGIVATNSGGGAISIDVNGTVIGAGGDGISAANDASGAGITITAAAVAGSAVGIKVVNSGAGAVSVRATGAVKSTGAGGIGINASAAGGDVTISAAAVAGKATGIKVTATGAAAVSVSASGSVIGTTGDGIFVGHDGTGATSVSVSGSVRGGWPGSDIAAIRTDVSSGSAVTVMLNRGASVGANGRNAIVDSGGAAAVTVNTGAAIAGKVSLGSGADTLAFAGGSFEAVTRMDGGDGPGDMLRFSGGSGSLSYAIAGSSGEGLKGWESVVIESGATLSGAIRLADDSGNLTFDGAAIGGVTALDGGGGSANTLAFMGVSGTLAASALTNWEDVVIGAGSRMRLTGSRLPRTAAARLSVTGTLAFGTTTAATDAFTVQGDFTGGGAVAIDANFSAPENGAPTADRLVIEGSATGTTVIALNDLTPADGTIPGGDIEVVSVEGGAGASAFTLANAVAHGAHVYGLAHVPDDTGDGAKFVLRPGSGNSDSGAVLRLAPAAIAAGLARSAALAARSAARMPGAAGSGIGAPMTLTERLKELIGQDSAGMGVDGGAARSLWARFHSDSQSSDAADGFGESEIDSAGVVFGADLLSGEAAGGMWIAGLTAQYGSVSAEARGAGGVGRQEATGYGLGAAATWLGANGLYADAAAQFGSFEADYSADSTGVIKNGVGGGTSSAALEFGRRFAAGDSMTLAPRGRLGWSSVSSDKFTSEDGVEIDLGTSSVAEASVGVAAEFGLPKGGVRVSGTLSRRLGDPDGVAVGGQTVAQAGPDGWMELGFGGTFDMDADSVVFLDGAYRAGGDSTGLSLSGGLKFNW